MIVDRETLPGSVETRGSADGFDVARAIGIVIN
jgi:hypothetical protein